MAVNKVTMNTPEGEQTLIDLTSDSVTPETLAEGATAHDASGAVIAGTMPTTTVLYTEQTLTEAQQAQARENIGALAQSELPEAVNDALAQAKESGEFDGATGQRGTGLLPITTAPSSYTTAVGGITPKYRIALSTVKTQSGATVVLVGDTLRYSYYHYPIAYVDTSYAYCTTRVSIRGATGAAGADGYTPQKGVDYYTEADKAEIVAMVIESLGGNPVFGYVDKNNNILVSGNLPDGTYSVKYEMEDGSTVNIGNLVLDTNVYYSVTNNLTNCTSNNSDAQAIGGQPYSATISAKSGYELKSVTVTMGGQAVSVNGGNISIAAVTGNIVITAVAEEIKEKYTNLADPASADWKEGYRLNSSAAPTNASNIVTGSVVTNFIGPIKQGDVIRVQGIYLNQNGHMSPAYKPDKSVSSEGSALLSAYGNTTCATNVTVTDTGAQFTVGSKDQIQNGYWRFSGVLVKTSADVIITINEEIV